MADSKSGPIHDVEGTTELEQALVRVEQGLDEVFEAAERRTQSEREGGAGMLLEQVLDLIYTTLSSSLPYDRIGLAVVEESGQMVRSRWARAEADSLTIGAGYAAPLDETSTQLLLISGEPQIINDLEAYLEEHAGSDPARSIVAEGMRSSLSCPLRSGDKPLGIIVFTSRQADAYSEEHRSQLAHVADHLAAILERACLYERLNELSWQLRVARDALSYQASHDGLTRLWNRSAILEGADRELDRARRQSKPITIVMADIDHFKEINDTHGHGVGDDVLRVVSNRMLQALRSYETVGRYGGEEFLVTLYDCNADGAPRAMERMRAAVAGSPVETSKGDVGVTISLGAASSADGTVELDDLIRVADEALYAAKEAGRDRHVVKTVESKKE